MIGISLGSLNMIVWKNDQHEALGSCSCNREQSGLCGGKRYDICLCCEAVPYLPR